MPAETSSCRCWTLTTRQRSLGELRRPCASTRGPIPVQIAARNLALHHATIGPCNPLPSRNRRAAISVPGRTITSVCTIYGVSRYLLPQSRCTTALAASTFWV